MNKDKSYQPSTSDVTAVSDLKKDKNDDRLQQLANKLVRNRQQSGQKRRKKKFIVWSVIILLIIIGGGLWWWLRPTPVEISIVSYQRVGPTANPILRMSGYVTYPRISVVGSTNPTPVKELNFREGDYVRQGDILARFDDSQLQAQLKLQEVTIAGLQRSLNRTRNLNEAGAVSEADLQNLQNQLATAQAQSNLIRTQIAQTVVKAPFNGLVIDKLVETGEIPSAGICRIADTSSTFVSVDINQEDISLIHENQPAVVTLDAYPDMEYAAVLSRVLPTANQAKNTIPAYLRVLKPDKRFIPLMSARVFFVKGLQTQNQEVKAALAIDKTAIFTENGKNYAWQVKRGQAYQTAVLLGDTLQNGIRMLSGLKADDRVILNPQNYKLYQGMHVSIK